jgi:hypothetical protein
MLEDLDTGRVTVGTFTLGGDGKVTARTKPGDEHIFERIMARRMFVSRDNPSPVSIEEDPVAWFHALPKNICGSRCYVSFIKDDFGVATKRDVPRMGASFKDRPDWPRRVCLGLDPAGEMAVRWRDSVKKKSTSATTTGPASPAPPAPASRRTNRAERPKPKKSCIQDVTTPGLAFQILGARLPQDK